MDRFALSAGKPAIAPRMERPILPYSMKVVPLYKSARAFTPDEDHIFAVLCLQTDVSWQTTANVMSRLPFPVFPGPGEDGDNAPAPPPLGYMARNAVAHRIHNLNFPDETDSELSQAVAVWRRVSQLDPKDGEIDRALAVCWKVLCTTEKKRSYELGWKLRRYPLWMPGTAKARRRKERGQTDWTAFWKDTPRALITLALHVQSPGASWRMLAEVFARQYGLVDLDAGVMERFVESMRTCPDAWKAVEHQPENERLHLLARAFRVAGSSEAAGDGLDWGRATRN